MPVAIYIPVPGKTEDGSTVKLPTLALQEELPPVFIDENKIREVLVNLITNAIHAMSAGDTVFVMIKSSFGQDGYVAEAFLDAKPALARGKSLGGSMEIMPPG